MEIKQLYESYEDDTVKKIKMLIEKERDTPHDVFNFLLKKIYKREK